MLRQVLSGYAEECGDEGVVVVVVVLVVVVVVEAMMVVVKWCW